MVIMVDDDKLRSALQELEIAAWSRSWNQLVTARGKILLLTGVVLTGKLKDRLRKDEQS